MSEKSSPCLSLTEGWCGSMDPDPATVCELDWRTDELMKREEKELVRVLKGP